MKKWLMGFLAAVILLLIAIYIFIPGSGSFKTTAALRVTGPGIHRMLLDKANVAKWWPGKIINDSFYLNDRVYAIGQGNVTVMPVFITGKEEQLTTSLFLISNNTDSVQLQWVGEMPASGNPFRRVHNWLRAKKISADMQLILQKMVSFYSLPENIYGAEIKKVPITDSVLIATSATSNGYPSTAFVYAMIGKLRKFAVAGSAKESGYPMLNITSENNIDFDVKVALPLDKMIPAATDIFQKRMPAMKPILVIDVTGGMDALNKGFEQIQKYADDHQLKTAAIPFYSLVTDRTKEPDTSKWITKIYYPVMLYH